jgi:hypothetical protein
MELQAGSGTIRKRNDGLEIIAQQLFDDLGRLITATKPDHFRRRTY